MIIGRDFREVYTSILFLSGYDVPSLSRDLDWIGLMTYDFHGSWDSTTGHNSPLYKFPGETGDTTVSQIRN